MIRTKKKNAVLTPASQPRGQSLTEPPAASGTGAVSCRRARGQSVPSALIFLEVSVISKKALINEEIKAKEVRVVSADGAQIGVLSIEKALRMAFEAGLDLVVTSGWRSWAYQEQLFEDKVARVMSGTGLDRAAAEEAAADEVARPGTSEHQLGLAVDIISNAHPELNSAWAETEEAEWLEAHCAEYGFILRYPPEKSEITGITWEPWHFRYVGEEAAVYIMENELCLEEYLAEMCAKRE